MHPCWQMPVFSVLFSVGFCRVTFEKITNVGFNGKSATVETPVTLSMCIKTCLAKMSCQAVTFHVSSLSCATYNETLKEFQLVAQPNSYYFRKIIILDEAAAQQCATRLWMFERFLSKGIYYDLKSANNLIKVFDAIPDHDQCAERCYQETDFTCRAAQYNLTSQQCVLFQADNRQNLRAATQDVNYIENLCLKANQACPGDTTFERYNEVVFPPVYFDKSLPAFTPAACSRFCLHELDFLCRAFLFDPANQLCILSHNDRFSSLIPAFPTLPRIYAAVLGRPLTEYYEVSCLNALNRYSSFGLKPDSKNSFRNLVTLKECETLCLKNETCSFLIYQPDNLTCLMGSDLQPATGSPLGYVGGGSDYVQMTCRPPIPMPAPKPDAEGRTLLPLPFVDSTTSNQRFVATTIASTVTAPAVSSLLTNSRQPTTKVTKVRAGFTSTNSSLTSISTQTTVRISSASVINSTTTVTPPKEPVAGCNFSRSNAKIIPGFISGSVSNVSFETCQLQCEAVNSCLSFSYSEKQKLCSTSRFTPAKSSDMLIFSADNDVMFYEKSETCTDVRFECTDSQIVMTVNTNKPFHGRVFVEGYPSSDCSARFSGPRSFSWSILLSAEPCNTVYSGDGVFTNTITLQHHNVLVTKNDRRYRISCKYDVDMVSLTSNALTVGSPLQVTNISVTTTPPGLSIKITDLAGNPVQSAIIGDTLLFVIAVPEKSPYGIVATNCYAFGEKEGERMQLTNDQGCPVLSEFFRPFGLKGKTLTAEFDAFAFRKSDILTYQCTVHYCLSACPQPECGQRNATILMRRKRDIMDQNTSDGSFVGAYNLRRQLYVSPVRDDQLDVIDPLSRNTKRSDLCLTKSLTIGLGVLIVLLILLDISFFIVIMRLRLLLVTKDPQ